MNDESYNAFIANQTRFIIKQELISAHKVNMNLGILDIIIQKALQAEGHVLLICYFIVK